VIGNHSRTLRPCISIRALLEVCHDAQALEHVLAPNRPEDPSKDRARRIPDTAQARCGVSVPRHVTRLATAAFLAGLRGVDLLALMPPSAAARFCSDAGLTSQEYLSAMGWIAQRFTMQHHADLLARREAAAPAEPSAALPAEGGTAGLLK
jgi:hypothetical protein